MIHLGLVGWPLDHSFSPKLHAAALKAVGLEGEYSLYPVPLEDPRRLGMLLDRLRSGELQGLNVTIPHKEAVIQHLDELTPTARAVGAVNTISVEDRRLLGHNTDARGFMVDLKKVFASLSSGEKKESALPEVSKSALVFGSGGSARAVVFALLEDGWEVTLAARNKTRSEKLIDQFSEFVSQISYIGYDRGALRSSLPGLTLIINTTPLGMFPDVGSSPWPEHLAFPSNAAIYDLVYNPPETLFARQARAAGLCAATGMGMLVEQAALAFEIWTGEIPPRSAMFSALEE
jgi:shikimate dehydrogenase